MDWFEYFDINNKYADNENKKNVLKFIFLWLKINEYCSQKYKDICGDKNKFLELKENPKIQHNYQQNSSDFLINFQNINNDRRPEYYIIDMKHQNKKVYFYKPNKQRLEDLLKVIYQIRCNFFHGEKEPTQRDLELISWAYKSLKTLTDNAGLFDN